MDKDELLKKIFKHDPFVYTVNLKIYLIGNSRCAIIPCGGLIMGAYGVFLKSTGYAKKNAYRDIQSRGYNKEGKTICEEFEAFKELFSKEEMIKTLDKQYKELVKYENDIRE